MGFRVELTPRAQEDIREIFDWIHENAPEAAARWYDGLAVKLASLEQHPGRCSKAPEEDLVQREIRQLYYGKRPRDWYRALFDIKDDRVRVLRVRRCTQDEVPRDQLESNQLIDSTIHSAKTIRDNVEEPTGGLSAERQERPTQ